VHIVTRILSSGTSLDYAVDTSPFPLQASPMDTSKLLTTATLTLIASNPKSTLVNLASVELAFDIAPSDDADDGTYLTSIGSGIGFVAYGDPEQKLWTCTNDGAGNLAATAKAGSVPITGQGLGLIVSNIQPNRGIGTFQLTITETVTGKGAAETVIEISKFPYEFFLTNLRADADQVAEGHGTTLRWDGGVGATLTIFHGGNPTDVTGTNSWPTGALTQDTEFTLQASVGDVAISTWNMTVQVSEPILTLTSLTVNQSSTLTGPVSAGSTLTVTGALVAQAGAQVSAGLSTDTITTSGNATIGDSLATKTLAVGGGKINASANGLSLGGAAIVDAASLGVQTGLYGGFCVLNWPYRGCALQITGGNTPPVAWVENEYGSPNGGQPTGLVCRVANPQDIAISCNGRISSSSGSTMLSHVPTRSGYRVITAPAVLEEELHLSGEGRLNGGRATVRFDGEIADALHHCANHPYRVQLTPTGRCGGLAVTAKSAQGFTVEELGGGASNAGFDWFVVARRPSEPGGSPRVMPEHLHEARLVRPEPEGGIVGE